MKYLLIRRIRKYARERIIELDEQILRNIIDGNWNTTHYLRCQREYWHELLRKTEETENG